MRTKLAVTATLATSLLAAACSRGGSDPEFRFSSSPLGTYQDGHVAAVNEMLGVADEQAGAVEEDSTCWLVAAQPVEDISVVNGSYICGPVLFPGGDPDAFYMTVYGTFDLLPVDGDPEDGFTQQGTGIIEVDVPQMVAPDHDRYLYRHPSGDTIPDSTDLTVPDFPAGDPDLATTVMPDDDDIEAPSDGVVDGTVRGFDGSVDISLLGTVETTNGDNGRTVVPADGYEFAVLDVSDTVLRLDDGRHLEVGVNVVSVPTGQPVEVSWPETVSYGMALFGEDGDVEVEHRWNVTRAKPIEPYEALYRDGLETSPWGGEIPCEWTPDAYQPDGPCTEDIKIEYSLSPWVGHTDRLLLLVDVDNLGEQGTVTVSIGDAEAERLSPTDVELAGSRADEVGPTREWLFNVPVDITTGSVTVNTGGIYRGDGWDPHTTGLPYTVEFTVGT